MRKKWGVFAVLLLTGLIGGVYFFSPGPGRFTGYCAFCDPRVLDRQTFYTGSDSKIGRCQGGALILGQAKPVLKEAEAQRVGRCKQIPKAVAARRSPGSPKNAPFFGVRRRHSRFLNHERYTGFGTIRQC